MEKLQGNRLSLVVLLLLHVAFPFFRASSSEQLDMPMHDLVAEISDIAGYGQERLSSVLVTGSITCGSFKEGSELASTSYVAGAKLAVACKDAWKRRKITSISGITDEYGDFMIDLPSRLHGIPKLEAFCMVKILHLPKVSTCHQKYLRKPIGIKLSSVGNSIRVYSTGNINLENHVI